MIGVSFGVLRFFIVNWKAEPIALAIGVDAKTLSGILDHTKANFPLDTYANVADDIQRQAAQVMDTFMTEIFGKGLIPWQSGESPAAAIRSAEGRYSPRGPDGKQSSRNVCGHTPEECEEKLRVLIAAMKAKKETPADAGVFLSVVFLWSIKEHQKNWGTANTQKAKKRT